MCACVALALVCYQRVDRMRWVLLMGLSLAAAGAFQYYAVCALFPFVVAEGAFLCKLVACGWECGLLWLAGCYP